MSGCYKFHDGERHVVAIGYEGRTRLHLAVITEAGVCELNEPGTARRPGKRGLPLADARYLSPLMRNGAPYPLDRALKAMRAIGRRNDGANITQAAKDILKRVSTETPT